MSLAALGAIFTTSFVVSLTGALSPGPLTTLAVREGVRRGFWAGPALAAGHGVVEGLLVIGLALGLNELLDTDAVTATVAIAGGAYLVYLGFRTVITAPKQELQLEAEGVPVGPGFAPHEEGEATVAQAPGPDPSIPSIVAQGPSPEPETTVGATGWSPGPAPAYAPAVAQGPSPELSNHPGVLRAIPAGAAAGLAVSGLAVSVTNPFWLAWWATIGTAYIVEALEQGVIGVGAFYTAHIITDIGWLSLIAFVLAGGRRLMSRAAYRGILGVCGLFLLALGGWFLSSGLGYVV